MCLPNPHHSFVLYSLLFAEPAMAGAQPAAQAAMDAATQQAAAAAELEDEGTHHVVVYFVELKCRPTPPGVKGKLLEVAREVIGG